jgi:hypothetical protein
VLVSQQQLAAGEEGAGAAAEDLEGESDPLGDATRREIAGKAIEAVVAASEDHHKVRANAARALGHLAPLIELRRLVAALLHCLQSSLPKARWNACYALASALNSANAQPRQPACPASTLAPMWHALAALLHDAAHFKVRIAYVPPPPSARTPQPLFIFTFIFIFILYLYLYLY